jgi:hypothetical protein
VISGGVDSSGTPVSCPGPPDRKTRSRHPVCTMPPQVRQATVRA